MTEPDHPLRRRAGATSPWLPSPGNSKFEDWKIRNKSEIRNPEQFKTQSNRERPFTPIFRIWNLFRIFQSSNFEFPGNQLLAPIPVSR
jgi:hypothetical protein